MLQTTLVYGGLTIILFLFACIASKRACVVSCQPYSHSTIPFFTGEIILILLIFSVVFGMRYDVGVDHLTYLHYYITGLIPDDTEPLFVWINTCFRNVGIHYTIYFAMLAFIQLFFILYSIKDERYIFPFLIISLFFGQFFWHWMNGIRQDIAACIYVFAVKFIAEKKLFKFLIFIIIAIGFHKASIILLPTYLLLSGGRDLSMNRFWQMLLLLIVGYLTIIKFDVLTSFFPIIDIFINVLGYDKYNDSFYNFEELTTTGIGLYVYMILDALVIISSVKMKAFYNNKKFIIYYNLYYWGMIAQLFLTNNMLLARPVRFFRCFKLLMLAYFLYYLYKNLHIKINIAFFLVSFMLLTVLFVSLVKNMPFLFFWDAI